MGTYTLTEVSVELLRSASTARTSAGTSDRMVDKSNESTTNCLRSGDHVWWWHSLWTPWWRSLCRVWSLAHRRKKKVTVKQVLQFYVAVLYVIAVGLQELASLKGRSWNGSSRLSRWAWSSGEVPIGEGVPGREGRMRSLHVWGLHLSSECCRWNRGGASWAAPRGQLPVVCCGMNSSASAVAPLELADQPYAIAPEHLPLCMADWLKNG